ncbi:MAG TPA: gluconate 2-dehydrogenase subunit 3 family protein [Vicinamibacteria bacterium]|nr:gluconate 2-dehydrogenase subunit 3 family protein [Vicinamibacteria bacterium]
MAEMKPLTVLPPAPPAAGGMDRRAAIRALAAGVGAGMALPAVAESHPVHRHLADPSALVEAEAAAAARDWKPAFLDGHQGETLVSLAEQVVPGSTSAGVGRFVDQLLSVDTQENQRRFLNALGAVEGESIDRFGRPWKSLTGTQQVELLTDASTAAPGARDAKGLAHPTLRDHFDHLKGWISGAYFSSEIGMRELGWTGNVFHATFPGCAHPDGHR